MTRISRSPALIEVAGAPRPGGASVEAAAGDKSVRDTIDALKQRVRELEEQVRQLQHPAGAPPQ
jgi:hypothetical protein